MRISELAADGVFTPSGLACVVVRPHPPSRPPRTSSRSVAELCLAFEVHRMLM